MPLINRRSKMIVSTQLPEQVDNVTIEPGNLANILTWTYPEVDQNNSYGGVVIIRKVGSCPTSISDGVEVYRGGGTSYTDSNLTEGTTYYYRFFAYNNALPSGYTRLDYIQSSGTQYINTGYTSPSNNLRIVLNFRYTASHSASSIFGSESSNSSSKYSICPWGDVPQFYVGGSTALNAGTSSLNVDYELDVSAVSGTLTAKWNGTPYTASYTGTLNTANPIALFGNNVSGTVSQLCSMRVYSCKIYGGGALVRNYIPAKNSSGTVGLYDNVNGVFYTDAAGGTFTAGSTVAEGSIVYQPSMRYAYETARKLSYKWNKYNATSLSSSTQSSGALSGRAAANTQHRSTYVTAYSAITISASGITGSGTTTMHSNNSGSTFGANKYVQDTGGNWYQTTSSSKISIAYMQNDALNSGSGYYVTATNVYAISTPGALVGQVESTNFNAYPLNGVEGNYYYEYIGDTPRGYAKIDLIDFSLFAVSTVTSYAKVVVDGTSYTTDATMYITSGTSITVYSYFTSQQFSSPTFIYLNGSQVAGMNVSYGTNHSNNASYIATYTLVVNSDTTITAVPTYYSTTNQTQSNIIGCTVNITTS